MKGGSTDWICGSVGVGGRAWRAEGSGRGHSFQLERAYWLKYGGGIPGFDPETTVCTGDTMFLTGFAGLDGDFEGYGAELDIKNLNSEVI